MKGLKKKPQTKRKPIFPLTVVLCVLLMGGCLNVALAQQQKAEPENPIQGVHAESSQVLWTGQGYKTKLVLENPPENITQEILEIEESEKQKVAEERNETETPGQESEDHRAQRDEVDEEQEENTIHYDDADDSGVPVADSEDDDVNQDGAQSPDDETDETVQNDLPSVASDLTDGEVVNAAYRTFYVRGEDCHGQYIGASGLQVAANGSRLYSTADDGEMVRYRLELEEGENKITIRVTDREGRTATVAYAIYKGEEKPPEPAGRVMFSLEATTVGLGYLIGPEEVVYYEGEQLSYVIDRVLQQHGYTYQYDGSLTNGFYLKHVLSPGISSGFSIPDDLYAKLLDVNCEIEGYHLDSLGEYDFTKSSGWIYFVNGAQMSSGISTYYPADGDELRIRFSLYSGADVGGSMQGETWGDW